MAVVEASGRLGLGDGGGKQQGKRVASINGFLRVNILGFPCLRGMRQPENGLGVSGCLKIRLPVKGVN
ncbi:hypothetical protein, partial [Kingella oralis]|uniref:hypothetical protein n=1 Tax=Kingella oralis TaxID=505 RepID=UPI0034E47154